MPDIFINSEETPVKKVEREIEKHPKVIHRLEGHSHSPLSAFCYFPDGVEFVAKDSKEKIVLLLRRHPVTNVPWIVISIIMLFAPGVLSSFPIIAFLPDNFQLIAIIMWYLVVVAYVFESFLDWFFSVFIVTDERIFDVDFLNLVYREISEANIDQIQDVTVTMGSVIRTVFGYGDVIIQTASEVPRIEFEAVPNPDRVAKILRELRVEEEQEKIEGRVR